jgi:hypothetical protein
MLMVLPMQHQIQLVGGHHLCLLASTQGLFLGHLQLDLLEIAISFIDYVSCCYFVCFSGEGNHQDCSQMHKKNPDSAMQKIQHMMNGKIEDNSSAVSAVRSGLGAAKMEDGPTARGQLVLGAKVSKKVQWESLLELVLAMLARVICRMR